VIDTFNQLNVEQIANLRIILLTATGDERQVETLCAMALASLTEREKGWSEDTDTDAQEAMDNFNYAKNVGFQSGLKAAANAEIMEQCRLNAMGSEREAKLITELELERKRRWEGNEISSNEHIAEVIQFKEKIRRARDEGIEAAAKVCDRWVESHIHSAIAKEIRALKGATDDQSQ
jgi:hypothetical protein